MQVTEVRIYPVDEDELRGYASITLDHCFMVRDFKILRNDSGRLYVAMPNRKQRDGTYREIAYPINAETRRMIEEAILAEYNKLVAKTGKITPPSGVPTKREDP
jgi:stage V sporulation protein G